MENINIDKIKLKKHTKRNMVILNKTAVDVELNKENTTVIFL